MSDFDKKFVKLEGVWYARNHLHKEHVEKLKKFETSENDVFVLCHPKCGEYNIILS